MYSVIPTALTELHVIIRSKETRFNGLLVMNYCKVNLKDLFKDSSR
jgi:hypothetical protein